MNDKLDARPGQMRELDKEMLREPGGKQTEFPYAYRRQFCRITA